MTDPILRPARARRPLRIAVIAHVRHPIRDPFMGGMESHAWHLTAGLRARGHDVALLASGDSDPALPLTPIIDTHYEKTMPWAHWRGSDRFAKMQEDAFARAMEIVSDGGFDVVHNNCLHPLPHEAAARTGQPMVTSLHVPPFKLLRAAVDDHAAPWMLNTVTSMTQLRTWWSAPPETARVAANGIDPRQWPYRERGDGGLIWIGRIAQTKGTADAIRAARLSGRPLTIYGPVDDETYYDEEVAPLLGSGIVHRGHLSSADLAQVLGRASALLFTPLWDEPFGLTAVEALACGVPVAAYDNGAAREVIGECGAYAEPGDIPGLARAIEAAVALPRPRGRERVERLFSLDRMIERYERCYAEAIDGARLAYPAVASHGLTSERRSAGT